MTERKPLFSLAPIAAAVLALGALAVVARQRREASRPGVHLEPELSGDHLGRIAGEPFFRLVRTYYEHRGFHLHHAVRRGAGRDADLYFGTLPHAVAVVRVLARGAAQAGLGDIEDLPETMRRRGVRRATVHHAGDYTAQAAAYARAHRIRLVPVHDFAANIARLPLAARLALCASLANARDARDAQQELELP